jgi:GNAT superfamily N-acetyltransferase
MNIKIVDNSQKKLTPQEWKAARYFRDKYFFGPNGIEDPYTWTFQHDEHVHFILYQDADIIGYAHIQRWPEHRVALRIIVIDKHQRNNNSGSVLLQFIEKWLKTLGIKSIHTESRKSSLGFYLKNGYIDMPFDDPEGHESHPDDIPLGKVL